MGKRLTTYQRLKIENAALKAEISVLVLRPKSSESLMIVSRYRLAANFEWAVWDGESSMSESKKQVNKKWKKR